jgi:hypothetical protein
MRWTKGVLRIIKHPRRSLVRNPDLVALQWRQAFVKVVIQTVPMQGQCCPQFAPKTWLRNNRKHLRKHVDFASF